MARIPARLSLWLGVGAWSLLAACSDEESRRNPTDAAADVSGSSDALPLDTSADAVTRDAPAATDSALDAAGDAAPDAQAPRLNVLYASFGGTLVRINPDDGTSVLVGVLRNKVAQTEVFRDVVMHANGQPNEALMVLDYANPALGTVDLCTGLVTKGATITRAASPSLVVEGLALHPNGQWYASGGNAPNPQSPISSYVGTLNTTTGVLTDLGTAAATYQDDVDMLFFRGVTLYGVDVATTVNRMDLFSVNLASGANTPVISPTYEANLVPLRLAYDASRDKTFAWRLGDRNLIELSLTANVVKPIGPTHTAAMYGNQAIRGFFAAPSQTCP